MEWRRNTLRLDVTVIRITENTYNYLHVQVFHYLSIPYNFAEARKLCKKDMVDNIASGQQTDNASP